MFRWRTSSELVVGAVVTHADGLGKRAAALSMLDTLPGAYPETSGAISQTIRKANAAL